MTVKRTASPDRRGMGAQSDFISESFAPSPQHRREQLAIARTLLQMGMAASQVCWMLSLPMDALLALSTETAEASMQPGPLAAEPLA